MFFIPKFAASEMPLQKPSLYQVLFQNKNALLSPDADRDAFIRSIAIRRYAQEFYQVAVYKLNQDEARIRTILTQVNQKNALPAFDREIAQLSKNDGKSYQTAREVLMTEFSQVNPFKRFFKQASQKERLDFLNYGENCFRASAWEYRRLGMWNAVADFVAVCHQYPVMSTGVIGAVAYLGHRYPFLGGVSGMAIIAWGVVASIVHEARALLLERSPQKAEHYVKSGENLAAALITGVGYKGIKNGTINGFEHAREKTALLQHASLGERAAKNLLTAVKATSKEKNKTNPLESVLFVSGLFDNVLLPFNWAADWLQLNK